MVNTVKCLASNSLSPMFSESTVQGLWVHWLWNQVDLHPDMRSRAYWSCGLDLTVNFLLCEMRVITAVLRRKQYCLSVWNPCSCYRCLISVIWVCCSKPVSQGDSSRFIKRPKRKKNFLSNISKNKVISDWITLCGNYVDSVVKEKMSIQDVSSEWSMWPVSVVLPVAAF